MRKLIDCGKRQRVEIALRKLVTPGGLMLASDLRLSAYKAFKGAGRDMQVADHVVSGEAAKVQTEM